MIIKKFQGKTEEEAIEVARKELGENMVVMNVKNVKKQGLFAIFKPAVVEVTAAVEEETRTAAPKTGSVTEALAEAGVKFGDDGVPFSVSLAQSRATSESSYGRGAATGAQANEMNHNIEEKLESLHSLIEERLSGDSGYGSSNMDNRSDAQPEHPGKDAGEIVVFLKLIYNTLVDNEVDEKYANELIAEIEKMSRPGMSVDFILANIYQKLILQFGQADLIQPSKEGPKVVFFIGPTGVGKTTTIAKIASSFCVREHKKIALVTTDTYRIAAAEQLKTYANILDVPFKVVYTVEEMREAYAQNKDKDYIFVDTTGHSPRNEGLIESTKQIIHSLGEDASTEVFLVLSATTKYRDLIHIADIYKEMADFKLIFSKLDETGTLGNLWNLKRYTGAQMSYITCGQNVPDDIAPFNPQTTVKQLLGGKID